MRLIDTHCHAHFRAYKDDMDEVVERALNAGVQMITVGTQSNTSRGAIELAKRYDGVWATIGLHPNHLHKQEFVDTNEAIKTRAERFDPAVYEPLVSDPKVVAVGEFGLDYFRIPEGYDREEVIADQVDEARKQLRFASQFEKPIVIHCRDAHDRQFDLLQEEIDRGGMTKRGVIHSFTGSMKDAERYRSIGFFLGLNGILTFSKELQEVAKQIPLEQIVVETDAPYLTPPPYRGKRNEPAYVRFIAEMIAELKGISVEEVAETTTNNAQRLFQLPD